MSRIGNKPINIPTGVDVKIDQGLVTIKGPKGTLEEDIKSHQIEIKLHDNTLIVSRNNEEIETKGLGWISGKV